MINKEVLASVSGKEITKVDVEMLIKSLDQQSAAQFDSAEGRNRLLEELINQELLYLDAVDNGFEKAEDYKAEVEKAKVNILKQYAMSKLLNSVTVQEGEVFEYYNQNNSFFNSPETVRASHILIDNEQSALQILSEIKNGLSFKEAAEKYSTCPSKSEGGDLGYFPRNSMVPEFENAVFNMETGQISEPVKTGFGYHIIMLVDRKPGNPKTFDEVKGQISRQILLQKQQELYLEKTGKLRNKYEIKINK